MRRALMVLLLAGCTGAQKQDDASPRAGKDAVAVADLKRALAALPKCVEGADVGRLVIRSTMCTRMFCQGACCNQCGWAASFEGMSGDSQPVDAKRVREVLRLGEGALDCEVKAWAQTLEGESVSLSEPACVVR